MRFSDNVLSSFTSFIVTVTSLSLPTTEDLASLLLYFAGVLLVGGGGGGGGGGVVTATVRNRSDIPSMMYMSPGSRRSNADLLLRLGALNGPSARQLNPDMLRSRLGHDFNGDRMSIERPSPHTHSTTQSEYDPELMAELKDLNFSYEDEHGNRRVIPAAVKSIFERWLLQRSSCPIRYAWEDMGVFFWPRWIKRGYCDTDIPCSWPPGMHCAPAESDTLRLLHWQCRGPSDSVRRRVKRSSSAGEQQEEEEEKEEDQEESGGGRHRRSQRQHCRWKKVPFPVTSECFCSC